MQRYLLRLFFLGISLAGDSQAFNLPSHVQAVPAASTANVRAAFAPGDNIAGQIVEAISHARHQVLVQAFSFTDEDIAHALIDARRRGVDVRVIADREQTEKFERGQVPDMARAGVPVLLDGDHQCAHNKVMVIDAGTPFSMVITGSFNFTRAAQHKNAENMVFISGNDALVQAYSQNWQRHLAHSQPLTIH